MLKLINKFTKIIFEVVFFILLRSNTLFKKSITITQNTQNMKTNFLTLLTSIICVMTYAQEQKEKSSKTTFTASVDTYYAQSFNNVDQTFTFPPYEDNEFSLGWVSVGVKHDAEKYGFQANLAVGPRNDNFYRTPLYGEQGEVSELNFIRDAFGYFNITNQITVSAGVFQAFYGYEFDDVHLNQNYSNGYVYGISTAGVMGAKVDYAFADKWNLMLALFNNLYQREEESNDGNKAFAVNLSYTDDPFWVAATYINSTEPDNTTYNMLDLVGGFVLSDKFTLGYSVQNISVRGGLLGNGGEANITAAALYPLITLSDKISIGIRGEILLDEESFYVGQFNPDDEVTFDKSTLYNITASLNYNISENVKVTPEIRLDGASEAIFTTIGRELVKDDSFALVSLTYLF